MKVAAYQVPLSATKSLDVVELIQRRVKWCEEHDVEVLCCPEAVLGGSADYADRPSEFALDAGSGQLLQALAPLTSHRVTTIVGFTELDYDGRHFNSAAIYHRGDVIGVYRKLYPAINRSVYEAGDQVPVFKVGELTFGILICRDSNYYEPARLMAAQGAAALFIPSNNGLPYGRSGPELVADTRNVDIARAVENSVYVIRADVAGEHDALISYGTTGIVDRDGRVLQSAHLFGEEIVVAEIKTTARALRRGWVQHETMQ